MAHAIAIPIPKEDYPFLPCSVPPLGRVEYTVCRMRLQPDAG